MSIASIVNTERFEEDGCTVYEVVIDGDKAVSATVWDSGTLDLHSYLPDMPAGYTATTTEALRALVDAIEADDAR